MRGIAFAIVFPKPFICAFMASTSLYFSTKIIVFSSFLTEVLKNWKGTRLPTHNDFFGFCGSEGGSADETYKNSCSSDTTHGNYGQMVGRTGECIDESNSGTWQWLSEQHSGSSASLAGDGACSNFINVVVYLDYRFRAVFRP